MTIKVIDLQNKKFLIGRRTKPIKDLSQFVFANVGPSSDKNQMNQLENINLLNIKDDVFEGIIYLDPIKKKVLYKVGSRRIEVPKYFFNENSFNSKLNSEFRLNEFETKDYLDFIKNTQYYSYWISDIYIYYNNSDWYIIYQPRKYSIPMTNLWDDVSISDSDTNLLFEIKRAFAGNNYRVSRICIGNSLRELYREKNVQSFEDRVNNIFEIAHRILSGNINNDLHYRGISYYIYEKIYAQYNSSYSAYQETYNLLVYLHSKCNTLKELQKMSRDIKMLCNSNLSSKEFIIKLLKINTPLQKIEFVATPKTNQLALY